MVIVDVSDAVIITISYKHFNIVFLWVEHTADTTGLVQRRVEGLLVFKGGFSVTKPGKNFIIERIYDFYFVIVSVGHGYHIFVRDETHS